MFMQLFHAVIHESDAVMRDILNSTIDNIKDIQLRRIIWRLFARTCDEYGVNGFDRPTFRILYPERFNFIQRVNDELRRRAQ